MQLVVQTVVDIGNFGFQLCDEIFLVFDLLLDVDHFSLGYQAEALS